MELPKLTGHGKENKGRFLSFPFMCSVVSIKLILHRIRCSKSHTILFRLIYAYMCNTYNKFKRLFYMYILNFYILILHMWYFACMVVYAPCAPGGQKMALATVGLELQLVVSYQGIKPMSSAKCSHCSS